MNKKELAAWMETTDNCLDDLVKDYRRLDTQITVCLRNLQDLETRFTTMQNVDAARSIHAAVHNSFPEPPLDSIVVDGDGFAWQRHRMGWSMAGCEDVLSWAEFLDEAMYKYEIISTEGRIERA